MILYFSATGNSKYCAEFLASRTDDEIVSINDMMKHNVSSLDCKGAERLGIIAPVYDFDLAYPVAEFLDGLTLANLPQDCYTYGVLNCGSMKGNSFQILRDILAKKNITLNAGFVVLMPDNYVLSFKQKSPAKKQAALERADKALKEIAKAVAQKREAPIPNGRVPRFVMSLIHRYFIPYQRKVSGFTVDNSCIGCGLCEQVCPRNIITLRDKRPVWTKDNCACCLACLHRCPKQAINRGGSRKNGRYLNPNVTL